jgi:hypothetical protein
MWRLDSRLKRWTTTKSSFRRWDASKEWQKVDGGVPGTAGLIIVILLRYWPEASWCNAEGAIFGALINCREQWRWSIGSAFQDNFGWKRPRGWQPQAGSITLDGASAESAGAWQKEVAERRPFSASPAAEKGSEIANRNSLREEISTG